MEHDVLYALFITISISLTFIIMLAACLCCRKKIPKNEFLGLEGMVKIKNHEDIVVNIEETIPIDLNSSSTGDNDSKRASNAPHRSLPDIPIAESLNDNGSELYATVADKVQVQPQGRSPTPSLKKQTSVSQHSSISQADDVSSPYARVKTPPHDYDNVLTSEHPYAQLNTPGPSTSAQQSNFEHSTNNSSSRRGSHQSLLGTLENQQEIPAASAIAGMISASQDLPYMTPPIIPQTNFSGDSQDSSKGYTSISVREPLANILAQTGHSSGRQNQKNINDSHYATVSDDSDEMYAAIDDPKNINQADVYTSGSETYAQIQPANPITVSVEINTSTSRVQSHPEPLRLNIAPKKHPSDTPAPPPVDSLKAQMHSRQASSSSNTSSVGIIGSPKPEKRQANSPLPPTPKNLQYLSNSNLTSTSSVPSGRNSVASVIETQQSSQLPAIGRGTSKENLAPDIEEESPKKKDASPSKDIEGMYAKVMKKNRFSNAPSQNSSPILNRKSSTDTTISSDILQTELNIKDLVLNAIQASPDKRRPRSSSYETKDHGYETIPADKANTNGNMAMNRKSDGYAQVIRKETIPNDLVTTGRALNLDMSQPADLFRKIDINLIPSEPGYESLPDRSCAINDPGYETLLKTGDHVDGKKPISDYDPNYEVLRPTKYQSSDDGYAKVWEKFPRQEDECGDGYSRVKENNDVLPGYSSIPEKIVDENHDYASISDDKKRLSNNKVNNNNNNDDTGSDLYSSILLNEQNLPYLDARENPEYHNYQTISETKSSPSATTNNALGSNPPSSDKLKTPSTGQSSPDRQMRCSSTSNTISSSQHQSSNYGSLTGSESDPNYESVRYLDSENPYERLHNDPNISPDVTVGNIPATSDKNLSLNHSTVDSKPPQMASLVNSENGEVEDYFQV